MIYEKLAHFQRNSTNECIFLPSSGKDGTKMTTVVATPGQGSDRAQEVSYTDTRVIGNGSFGVVFQAKLVETNELVAIKKVLQDRRFKVSIAHHYRLINRLGALPSNFSL